jgi:hypothetical protein
VSNPPDLQQFQFVDTKGVTRRDLRYSPDFLILGPQRTGTTWLAKILWQHPKVFMSFPKELYFFNLLRQQSHGYYKSKELRWYLNQFRDNAVSYALKTGRSAWSYGERYRPVARGEATASYAAMPMELIAEVIKMNPDIKGIITVRDPIARAWSHAKKDLVTARKRKVKDVSMEEFESFFRNPYQLACADYRSIVENWSKALRPANLLVARFEDIGQNPRQFLERVLSFIGVPCDIRYIAKYADVRVNSTEDADLPSSLRRRLEEILPSLDPGLG